MKREERKGGRGKGRDFKVLRQLMRGVVGEEGGKT